MQIIVKSDVNMLKYEFYDKNAEMHVHHVIRERVKFRARAPLPTGRLSRSVVTARW